LLNNLIQSFLGACAKVKLMLKRNILMVFIFLIWLKNEISNNL
jgi:hypothetical protein